ncbi:MAG: hypothetical protein HY094_01670 [Candidatus Melainabacteria bacterium]|nr:hypothetical protein [Candidatus Melainabacteria bacterium]
MPYTSPFYIMNPWFIGQAPNNDEWFQNFRRSLRQPTPGTGGTGSPGGNDFDSFRESLRNPESTNPVSTNTGNPSSGTDDAFNRFRMSLRGAPSSLNATALANSMSLVPNPNGIGLLDSQANRNRGRYFVNPENGTVFYEAYTLRPGETARADTETIPLLFRSQNGRTVYDRLPAGTATPQWLIAINRLRLFRDRSGIYRTSLNDETAYHITPDGRIYSPNRRRENGATGPSISQDGETWVDCPNRPAGLDAIAALDLRRGIDGNYTHPTVQGTFTVNATNGLVQYTGTGTPPNSTVTGNQFYDSSNPNNPRWIRGTASTYSYLSGPATDGSGTWLYSGGHGPSRNDSAYILSNGDVIMLHSNASNTTVSINIRGSTAGWEDLAQARTLPPSGANIETHRHHANNEINQAIIQILTSRTNRSWTPPAS